MAKELILITAGYPYGNSETFLETEISYLSQAFDKVKIIVINSSEKDCRIIPDNCEVINHRQVISNLKKPLMILHFFNPIVIRELFKIKQVYKRRLNFQLLKTLLVSFQNGRDIKKTLQITRNSSYKQVYYSYWSDDAAIGLALLKLKFKDLKAVSRCHGWDVYFDVHPLKYLPFRHLISEQLNNIFTISDKGKNEIEHVWKITDLKKVETSRLGVKTHFIHSRKEKSRTFTLVSCSNVIALKRVDLIAQAILKSKDPIRWIHFGDGTELGKIKNRCETEKKNHHEISFQGSIANEKILSFYQDNFIDIFINVSTSEGIPVSIMEAMSFGIPCIATNVGGTSEIVNNENGYLLTENPSVEEIVFQIERFRSMNKEEYAKFSKNAYKKWEDEYNAEKNFTQFVKEILSN